MRFKLRHFLDEGSRVCGSREQSVTSFLSSPLPGRCRRLMLIIMGRDQHGQKYRMRSDMDRDSARSELYRANKAREEAESEASAARKASYLAYKESKKEKQSVESHARTLA